MMIELFTVDDSFPIRGRGRVLLPGISVEHSRIVKLGDELVIQKPDGSTIRTTLRGMEHFVKWVGEKPANLRYGIMTEVDDVPIGSIVSIERTD